MSDEGPASDEGTEARNGDTQPYWVALLISAAILVGGGIMLAFGRCG